MPLAALRPLDQQHRARVRIVADTDEFELLGAAEPIQIKVIDGERGQLVGFDKGIGGAFHRPAMTEGSKDAAAQRGLAGAQFAVQIDDCAASQRPRQRSTTSQGCRFIGQWQQTNFSLHRQLRRQRR